jgi:hypothetical protein
VWEAEMRTSFVAANNRIDILREEIRAGFADVDKRFDMIDVRLSAAEQR